VITVRAFGNRWLLLIELSPSFGDGLIGQAAAVAG